jgi:tetratricopeptide (TPR) repeat protein
MPDPLKEIQQLIYLGKLPEAIQQAQRFVPLHPSEASLLLIRCLLLQGRFKQAEAACQSASNSYLLDGISASELFLWRAYIQIYTCGDPHPAIETARSLLARLSTQASPDTTRLLAQAHSVLGKALALAVDWGLLAAKAMAEARNLLAEAANLFRQTGVSDESLSAFLSLGQLYLMSPDADDAHALALFQQVQEQAQNIGNMLRLAESTQRLAEQQFEVAGIPDPLTPDDLQAFSLYQQALDIYRQADYALGPADIWLSLGRKLFDTGIDGTVYVQKALAWYRRQDNLSGVQSSLSSLGIWYTRQGRLESALYYHRQNAAITQEMGFSLGEAMAYLGLGDYYFRVSDYAKALSSYEQAEKLAASPVARSMVGLTLTTTYTQMHLPDRAGRVCRQAIETLAPAGASKRLSLARYILGNVLSSAGDWAGALVAWQEGLAEDEARHDQVSLAEKLQCIAQATVMQHYQSGGPPVPETAYAEAMSYYARSIAVLDGQRGTQGAAVIANTYQLQGQTAVVCGRPTEAARARSGRSHLFGTPYGHAGRRYLHAGRAAVLRSGQARIARSLCTRGRELSGGARLFPRGADARYAVEGPLLSRSGLFLPGQACFDGD